MKCSRLIPSIALLVPLSIAQNDTAPWRGSVYGASNGNDEVLDYLYTDWPYRNNSDYGLRYLTFNWSGPSQDNGAWTLSKYTLNPALPLG